MSVEGPWLLKKRTSWRRMAHPIKTTRDRPSGGMVIISKKRIGLGDGERAKGEGESSGSEKRGQPTGTGMSLDRGETRLPGCAKQDQRWNGEGVDGLRAEGRRW